MELVEEDFDPQLYKRKRSNLQFQVKLFSKFLTECDQSAGDSTLLVELESRKKGFETVGSRFEEVQSVLESLDDDDVLEEHYNVREKFMKDYYSCIAKMKMLLATKIELQAMSAPSTVTTTMVNRDSLKLPDVKLPMFDGSYDMWLEYRDTFKSLILDSSRISTMEKFHYLRASLQGVAYEIVHDEDFVESNFEKAWQALCIRYNNEKLLVNHHAKALLTLPPIDKETSEEIRRFYRQVSKHTHALRRLGHSIDDDKIMLMLVLTDKLDVVTAKEWEKKCSTNEYPLCNDLIDFLKNKAILVEKMEKRAECTMSAERQEKFNKKHREEFKNKKSMVVSMKTGCFYCKDPHTIYKCERFLALDVKARIKRLREMKHCLLCLMPGHVVRECKGRSCYHCGGNHNTLLHIPKEASQGVREKSEQPITSTSVSCSIGECFDNPLLSTAIVKLKAANGSYVKCIALLDSGSQINLITKSMARKLGVKEVSANINLIGVGVTNSNVNTSCLIDLRSCDLKYRAKLSCLVLPRITKRQPALSFDISMLKVPAGVVLANPQFNIASDIDLLIGVSLFWDLIVEGKIELGVGMPTIHNTKLGWIITGFIPEHRRTRICNTTAIDDKFNLERFWSVEEAAYSDPRQDEKLFCEQHFIESHKRDDTGRFVVEIPFNDKLSKLGDTKKYALQALLSLERRLARNPLLRTMYVDFMRDYEVQGHMSEVPTTDEMAVYLPHHGVLKPESESTKLRVVFNGSARSSSSISLNDAQYVGPTIQSTLFSILLRFRLHMIVVSADVRQMYRQIMVHPKHRRYQRVLWREDEAAPIKEYELNTVTYGTASAPYLAIRCLHQVAEEYRQELPRAAATIQEDFYVDDFLSGGEEVDEVASLCEQVKTILASGGFELRKWCSNNAEIEATNETQIVDLVPDVRKMLGISWNNTEDVLMLKLNSSLNKAETTTKRTMLSAISSMFDPLGLVNPVIVQAKILIQDLWKLKLEWDDNVPNDLEQRWLQLKEELPVLSKLRIERHIALKSTYTYELHGYCDASKKAYGAAVYLKSVNSSNEVKVNLICAKSRVAPVKVLSIPRLELCGATVLAELMNEVTKSLKIDASLFYWCDSEVALHWIKTDPVQLQVFVSNRVSKIISLSKSADWHYVNTKRNPADILVKGTNPSKLLTSKLWWHGPESLMANPMTEVAVSPDVDVIRSGLLINVKRNLELDYPFHRFSRLTTMIRVTARMMRWRVKDRSSPLTASECEDALKRVLRIAQQQSFSRELYFLNKGELIEGKSPLLSLCPFVDKHGLLRVGGRLQNTDYDYNKKHPVLLSGKHCISRLVLRDEHLKLMHAGPRTLLSSARDKYWITSGINLAKNVVHKCVKCYRFKHSQVMPLMGSLPKERVSESYPFRTVGVDYAGPFLINDKRGRGAKKEKCYVCVFICFATKCIHLEPVTALSTDSFIAVLRRFSARRGKPQSVYSDNGTNFVGAQRELAELATFLRNQEASIRDSSVQLGIEWHFIPPHSPHFGGLWEASVKSMKFHLKRNLQNTSIVYEEFNTVLCQIESILNSRPLFPLSSDPNDLQPLTPAHFLIGRSLTSVADPDLTDLAINRLSRFQYIQSLQQHIWQRWKADYVNQLQQRLKWSKSTSSLQPGQLVLIKDDHAPPTVWKMGRILVTHPGKDKVVRVATVRTSEGEAKRAISKLCPLPVNDEQL